MQIQDGRVVIQTATSSRITPEFLEWTDAFIERHRELLERLA